MTKFNTIVVALAAAAGLGTAVAQEATPDTWTQAPSVASRADVKSQAVAAVRAGQVQYGEVTRFVDQAATASKTRAQVAAEAREAIRLGSLSGETNVVFTPAQLEQLRIAGERGAAGMSLASVR